MIAKLLKKEFSLAMHPTVPVMMLLSSMILIPNYPYSVAFFYLTLSLFFTCLLGRENNDVVYSLTLPVTKRDVVKARFLFTVLLELLNILLAVPFIFLNNTLYSAGNEAGMDASLVIIADGFIIFGLFNLIFFSSYYKNVSKVGISFVKASVVTFLYITAETVCCFAVPYVRDVLDTPGTVNLTDKLVVLGIALVFFLVITFTTYKRSVKAFIAQDL